MSILELVFRAYYVYVYCIVEQNLVRIGAAVLTVTLWPLHDAPLNPLYESMTSSTKPELHNI